MEKGASSPACKRYRQAVRRFENKFSQLNDPGAKLMKSNTLSAIKVS